MQSNQGQTFSASFFKIQYLEHFLFPYRYMASWCYLHTVRYEIRDSKGCLLLQTTLTSWCCFHAHTVRCEVRDSKGRIFATTVTWHAGIIRTLSGVQ